MEELQYKMYAFVLYQLSDKQKGIQAQHAISRYGHKFKDDPAFISWVTKDETTIILTPGGSIQMEDTLFQLLNNNIEVVKFHEPDLDKIMTAYCFLVDERVWNREKYPDPEPGFGEILKGLLRQPGPSALEKLVGTKQNVFLRSFLPQFKLA